jgi:hypothetical protein
MEPASEWRIVLHIYVAASLVSYETAPQFVCVVMALVAFGISLRKH